MTPREAITILKACGLSSITSARLIRSGIASSNYLCDGGDGLCVARFDRPRTIDDVRTDWRLAASAAAGGVAVPPEPFLYATTPFGALSVRAYVAGDEITTVGVADASRIATIAARLHSRSTRLRRRHFYTDVFASARRQVLLTDASRVRSVRLRAIAKDAAVYLDHHTYRSTAANSLVHGDLKPANFLRLANGDDVMVLDWEKACGGDPVLDAGLAIFHLVGNAAPVVAAAVARAGMSAYCDDRQRVCACELWRAARRMSRAFILMDIAKLARAESDNGEHARRRREYVSRYCLPTFIRFLNVEEILSREYEAST